jgi:acyl carrier protein
MLSSMLGTSHLRAEQALDALPGLLATGRPVVGLADVAWGTLRAKLPGLAGPFWSEMPASDSGSGSSRLDLSALPAAEAAAAAQSVLVEEIARILQQAPSTIDIDRPIQDFGVDSLMAVELRTALEARLGMAVPVMTLAGAGTLRVIANRLIETTGEARTATAAAEVAAAILRHEGAMADPATGDAA